MTASNSLSNGKSEDSDTTVIDTREYYNFGSFDFVRITAATICIFSKTQEEASEVQRNPLQGCPLKIEKYELQRIKIYNLKITITTLDVYSARNIQSCLNIIKTYKTIHDLSRP